ncbi:MAG TPA: phage tail protein [Solirubrobacteraceae bacterium]
MSIVGRPRSFFKKFLFTVEIPGVGWTGFQKCSEPKQTTAVIEQWEGGAIVADKSPGRIKMEDVTLERGATKDNDLYAWYLQVNDAASGTGKVDEVYKRTVNIVQRDRDGSVLRRWSLLKAWPTIYGPGDWDNTADANGVETLVLCYQYPEPNDKPSVG